MKRISCLSSADPLSLGALNNLGENSSLTAKAAIVIEHGGKIATIDSAFQPIFSTHHTTMVGTEALLRARDHDGMPISVEVMFSEYAPTDGIWLDCQCHRAHLQNASAVMQCDESLFLNVRPETLLKQHYVDELVDIIQDAGLNPSQVVIEVLEQDCSIEHLSNAVNHYRTRGFAIAIDDFGIGRSNIDRIVQLAPDIVKFDRMLLAAATENARAALLFSRLISLLHATGSTVIVEGVESQKNLDLATAANADMVQGFYLARPSSRRATPRHAEQAIARARDAARKT